MVPPLGGGFSLALAPATFAITSAARLPFAEALRNQPREILIGIGLVVTVPTVSYMGVSYLPNNGTSVLGLDRTSMLIAGIVGGFLYPAGILIGGLLADRRGRRRTLLMATVLAVVWTPLMFPVAKIGSIGAFTVCLCITIFIGGLALGPVGAVLSELFQTTSRR